MMLRDVAETDAVDQAFVAGSDYRGQLRVESFLRHGIVYEAQVHRCEPIHAERCEVLLDAQAELIRLVVRQDGAGVITAHRDLAYQRQPGRIRVQRLMDQFVYDARAVVLRGIDVIDPAIDCCAEHAERFVTISRRAEYAVAKKVGVYSSVGYFFNKFDNVIETPIGRFENEWDASSFNISVGARVYPFK